MRYAITRYNQHQRDVAYRIYVTDCLRTQLKLTSAFSGQKLDINRFADVYYQKPADDRTAEDIIDGIKNKLK